MSWLVGDGDDATSARAHRAESCPTAIAVLDEPGESHSEPAPDPDHGLVPMRTDSDTPWWEPQATHRPTELLPPKRPDMGAEAVALEKLLVEQFDGHDLDLPPFSNVPDRVLRHLSDAQCSFDKITREIAEDQVITAAVIRMASSPMYRGATKITGIKPAITRIGTRALRALMYNQTLRVVTLHSKCDETLAAYVMRRSLASAATMQALAEFFGHDREEGLLLGLLHDIGYVVVLREAHRQRRHVKYQLDLMTFEYLAHECHQEFGELIAGAWSLPEKVTELIANHHTYPEPEDPLGVERLLLQVSDMVVSLLGYAPYVPYDLLNAKPFRDLDLHKRPDLGSFLEDLPARIEENLEYL